MKKKERREKRITLEKRERREKGGKRCKMKMRERSGGRVLLLTVRCGKRKMQNDARRKTFRQPLEWRE